MSGQDKSEHDPRSFPASRERLIYVMPEEAIQALAADEMSLLDLWVVLWRNKWSVILITAAFSIAAVIYSLAATEWYRAEAVLAPADERSTQGLSGALGGLANLAGVSAGGNDSVEALAVLRSREFAASFIQDLNLLPVFSPEAMVSETAADRFDATQPDMRDAVKYFSDNVLRVTEDRETQLVTLAIEWTEPEIAADWANALVHRLNERMRQRSLLEAETNLAYLQTELGKTSVVTLQQSIGRLMEGELQKLMLARGNEQFAFKIIDPAQAPKMRSRPRRTLFVILAAFLGGAISLVVVLVRDAVRRAGGQFPTT